ncbi:MAG: hypothetical protein JW893_08450 [Candidatus Omnitrophica bacterium]|nr:hypothetical protein [Candidatus Omnitrophota bacterium]
MSEENIRSGEGLAYIPDLGSEEENNRDFLPKTKRGVPEEFSPRDRKILKQEFLKVKDYCRVILEIGTARHEKNSSTRVLLRLKRPKTFYFGVDLLEKPFLKEDRNQRIYFFQTNSSKLDLILNGIREASGTTKIDFLFIDGYHSVKQILDDWRFASYVDQNGVIVIHDSNEHPGPVELLKAIRAGGLFTVKKYFEDRMDDWGIAVVKRI